MKNNNKYKILVTGPSITGGKGGQVTHLINLLTAFKANKTVQLEHFVSSSALSKEESSIKKLLLLFYRCIKFPFHLSNISAVHINSSLDNKAMFRDSCFMCWALAFKKRVIVQYHGGRFESTYFYKVKIYKKLWLYLLGKIDLVLTLTENQAELLTQHGIQHTEKVANYVCIAQESCTKHEPFTFTFLGRILKEKGIFEILDACQALKLANKHFAVRFYGDGPQRALLLEHISSLKIENNVTWHGVVDGQTKIEALASSHVFLLPSYAEGLPYSVLEAMSLGLPVIATDVGAMTKVVKHNQTGLIIESKSSRALKDAMLSVMENHETYQSLSHASKQLIKDNYSSEQMMSTFLAVWLPKANACKVESA